LNENRITDISALVNLPNLRKLDLNTNKIVSIANKPHLPSLIHLDLGNNSIKDADELMHLGQYRNLAVIIMTGCPYAEEVGEKLKNEILISLGL
jgi:Leucine-rich repeat (LRR) protein